MANSKSSGGSAGRLKRKASDSLESLAEQGGLEGWNVVAVAAPAPKTPIELLRRVERCQLMYKLQAYHRRTLEDRRKKEQEKLEFQALLTELSTPRALAQWSLRYPPCGIIVPPPSPEDLD